MRASNEPVGSRWDTGRTEAFSDGVFAIALIVLDLGVPASDFDDLRRGIAEQWPAYPAYTTSFVTIGGIWLAHHGVFRRLAQADQNAMRLNLLLLMAVAFLPFPTSPVRGDPRPGCRVRRRRLLRRDPARDHAPLLALWSAVARDRSLLRPEVTDDEVRASCGRRRRASASTRP